MSAALAVIAAALFTQAAPAAPTVDQIVSRHVAARGGREALRALRTVRMSGRATAGPGRTAIVRREIARPGRIRTEVEFQGTTGVYAWDGRAGWRVSPLDGSLDVEPLSPEDAASAAEQADIEGPLVDWRAKGHSVELGATETLPGGPAQELKVTLKTGSKVRLWVDAATGQVARLEATRRFRGREATLQIDYADYSLTGGVSFPRTIDVGARGRPQRLHIVVESVETNPQLDASRFRKPR
jgi:hypothetical protein